jgi:hypothetical protein
MLSSIMGRKLAYRLTDLMCRVRSRTVGAHR